MRIRNGDAWLEDACGGHRDGLMMCVRDDESLGMFRYYETRPTHQMAVPSSSSLLRFNRRSTLSSQIPDSDMTKQRSCLGRRGKLDNSCRAPSFSTEPRSRHTCSLTTRCYLCSLPVVAGILLPTQHAQHGRQVGMFKTPHQPYELLLDGVSIEQLTVPTSLPLRIIRSVEW